MVFEWTNKEGTAVAYVRKLLKGQGWEEQRRFSWKHEGARKELKMDIEGCGKSIPSRHVNKLEERLSEVKKAKERQMHNLKGGHRADQG